MTIYEFLEALKAAREDGYRAYLMAAPYGQTIRLKSPRGTEHCPITAVCEHHTGQTFPPAAVYSTCETLGLSPDDAYTLTAAADLQAAEPLLRQQLLIAVALREGPARLDPQPTLPNLP
jgi:hypothetical protein